MKRSEVEKELVLLKASQVYMMVHGTGNSDHQSEVNTKIRIYEKLLSEGYDDKS